MSDPQVSVVMPVYNAGRYVSEAVESILSQTFRDLEFLIFDDGSTDRSLLILQEYANRDDRIRLFAKSHRGYVPWLNEGIRIARGKFLARMDADDISLPHRFARQVKFLCEYPDCVVVGCDMLMIDPDGAPVGEERHAPNHEAIEADMLKGVCGAIAHPTSMMRRAILLNLGGYREKLEPIEDFDLWFRLAERGRLANIQEVLIKYRLHHSSVSVTHAERQKRWADVILTEARRRRGLEPLAYTVWQYPQPTVSDKHCEWAFLAAIGGYRFTAFKHLFYALREAPFSPRSWETLLGVLCRVALPRELKHLLKKALVSAGLWRQAY